MMGIACTVTMRHTHMGYPPIHIGTYMYVCPSTNTAWGARTPHVYPHVRTAVYAYVYTQVAVLPTHAMGP